MNPAAPFPSLTSTSGRPICRFCLDGDESNSSLIRPCDCRGTVALVHSSCLEKWVETNKNLVCQMCLIPYEQQSAGLKKISEWTWPRALSEDVEDVLDFYVSIGWIFCISHFGIMWMTVGGDEALGRLSSWTGTGPMYLLWCFSFLISSTYYGAILILVVDKWITENTTYKFKDRSTATERRDLERKQSQGSVTSEVHTD